MQPAQPVKQLTPYFWGNKDVPEPLPVSGYEECRNLMGDCSLLRLDGIVTCGLEKLNSVFKAIDEHGGSKIPHRHLVDLKLSPELQQWRTDQHRAGRVLPSKGSGLARVPDKVIELLNAQDWPEPLLTRAAFFGCGLFNMLCGAYDAHTLYSNYCLDMIFYWEHAYHHVFPDFVSTIEHAIHDPHALVTLGGRDRRTAAGLALRYMREKTSLEEQYVTHLSGKVARVNRDQALPLWICESSIWPCGVEAIARGFDCAATAHDLMQSVPLTDIVDVGSDLVNSELLNALLNTADICDAGVITEENLRCAYDACVQNSARMLTERWSDPSAKICMDLYVWHILNDRHNFLRRALLGYHKVRKTYTEQREADFGETFDPDYRTTGFSRPLQSPCDGHEYCDHVQKRLKSTRNGTWLNAFQWQ
ncbi:uncharacterized protein BO88DRAFT_423679 [Aspergillus vadensis CBS 113365]|uniref:Uncharacterized protein n=1 Tax=Aspergillus vadensis (strain CBS 113365 / IMI 142717 / IBT 24658) TaxID=1448311 RepID=A0A319BI87_ASPVC|nr:hypothetical protein BO88DRAFT_423679 [Aspergillus vadensis CBS 113365]PYH71884.1 hypothetical protein BO88DRAFT_423679 [Aspergillus vadensis CBS 113365]